MLGLYWGYIQLYKDNGKENGGQYLGLGAQGNQTLFTNPHLLPLDLRGMFVYKKVRGGGCYSAEVIVLILTYILQHSLHCSLSRTRHALASPAGPI